MAVENLGSLTVCRGCLSVLRGVETERVFTVGHISEDAVLSMPFLVTHKDSIELNQPVVLDKKPLECTTEKLVEKKNNWPSIKKMPPLPTKKLVLKKMSPVVLARGTQHNRQPKKKTKIKINNKNNETAD